MKVRMNPRFAWPTALVLLVALVPTVANVYMPVAPIEGGTLAERIPERLEGHGKAQPGKHAENPAWALENYGSDDSVSRRYAGMEFFAARTYDAKRLFHYPELALTYGHAANTRHSTTIETHVGTTTVQLIDFESSRGNHVAAYVLFYGRRSVDEPYSFMVGVLPELFAGGREPATLIYVQASARKDESKAQLKKRLLGLLDATCAALLGAKG